MDVVYEFVLPAVAVISTAAAMVMLFFLLKVKKKYSCIQPECGAKGLLSSRADALKVFYEKVYYSCDNFPKYAGKLSGYFSQGYEDGAFSDFMADIVMCVNLAEGGALKRMAREFSLTDVDLKTCCYIYLGFTWQQACTAELISENAYNVRCSRIRRKLGLEKDETISGFIAEYCRKHSSLSVR